MSHGRAGWNAITSSGEDVAANYGRRIPSSKDRYGRAHETIQLIQALWGSWGKDAWIHNQETGQFVDTEKILPINLKGKYAGSRGPLYIPPSEQGQQHSPLKMQKHSEMLSGNPQKATAVTQVKSNILQD